MKLAEEQQHASGAVLHLSPLRVNVNNGPSSVLGMSLLNELCADADCVFGHGWLAVVVAGFSPGLHMVAGALRVRKGEVGQFTDCCD